MSAPNQTIENALKSVGLGGSGIDRIKFGNGVVGKIMGAQMGLYVICFAGVTGGVWLGNLTVVFSFGGAAAASFIFSSISSMWYATRYPSVALLEGGELIKYRQIEMGASNIDNSVSQQKMIPSTIDDEG